MSNREFRRVSEPEAGVWRTYRLAKCDDCSWEGRVADNTRAGMPPELTERKLRQQGWETGQHQRCPKCVQKRSLTPSQKRAAFCRINEVKRKADSVERIIPTPQEQVPLAPQVRSDKQENTMAAEPPRQPTNQDRRRIRDALEEHYLEDKGCYRQNFTDEAIAAKLDVPVKWVADLRELNGYGPNANEGRALIEAELKALKAALAEQQDLALKAMGAADEIEKRLNRVEVQLGYRKAA